MRVTTGGVTVAAGSLIVGALGVTAVVTIRDEANDAGSSDCEAQSEATARKARRALIAEHIDSDRDAARRWFTGAFTSRADLVRQTIDTLQEDGVPVSGQLPDEDDEGFVVVVQYNRAGDLPSLPECLEGTPVIYVGGGTRLAG
jgi:hypothetical protein